MEAGVSKLRFFFRLKIHAGKLDEFKAVAAALLAMVQEQGRHTLEYEWFLNGDQTECVVLETFADSDALLTHADMVAAQAGRLFALCDMQDLWLCGEPSPAVLQRAAAFAPRQYSFLQGRG